MNRSRNPHLGDDVPASDEWDLDHGAVWTEVVSDEGRAITLRHPTNPYVDQWPDENPDSLVKIGAAYLRKVRDAFGLPAHLFDDHELEFRMPPSGLPLAWLPLGPEDSPGPGASFWIRRYEDPINHTGHASRQSQPWA